MEESEFDIIIIGAGWHGLTQAKTHLQLNPSHKLLVLDSAASPGGVWARERLYSGLRTNNVVGSYEFSDLRMLGGGEGFDGEKFGLRKGMHIPGEVVGKYLEEVVGLFIGWERLRCGWRVESAESVEVEIEGREREMGWRIEIVDVKEQTNKKWLTTRKLVVATGLTSQPNLPTFKGRTEFNGPVFHAKELRARAKELVGMKEVVVLGGNKSAWDTGFFSAVDAGVGKVHMIVRPDGGGPSWLWPVWLSPLKVSVQQLATTRFFTWFDPCVWAEWTGVVGLVRRALHGTTMGRFVVRRVWSLLEGSAVSAHRYSSHPGTKMLKPWVGPFWMGNSLSVHNYPSSWLDLVRQGKIEVHVADIDHLSEGTVHLSDGVDIKADAMVCCTGWDIKPPFRFLPEGTLSDLGFGPDQLEDEELFDRARAEIHARIPALRHPPRRTLPVPIEKTGLPVSDLKHKTVDRYQLYRFLIPSNEKHLKNRNIAFLGAHLALSAIMVAQLQALWVSAYFMDEIPHLNPGRLDIGKVKYETILHNEYTRIRHPRGAGGSGERCPDLTFDCLSYIDLLENDLGLKKYRKSSLWAEAFHRYGPADFQDLAQEWESRKRRKGNA